LKRGSFQDLTFLGLFAFVMIIASFLIYYVFHQVSLETNSALQAVAPNPNTTAVLAGIDTMTSGFVFGIPIGLFLGGLFMIALASFIPVHPVFLPLGILSLLASVVFFVFLQNAAVEILAKDFFVPFTTQFPLASGVLTHLALLIAAFGAIMLIVIYGRFRSQGGAPEG